MIQRNNFQLFCLICFVFAFTFLNNMLMLSFSDLFSVLGIICCSSTKKILFLYQSLAPHTFSLSLTLLLATLLSWPSLYSTVKHSFHYLAWPLNTFPFLALSYLFGESTSKSASPSHACRAGKCRIPMLTCFSLNSLSPTSSVSVGLPLNHPSSLLNISFPPFPFSSNHYHVFPHILSQTQVMTLLPTSLRKLGQSKETAAKPPGVWTLTHSLALVPEDALSLTLSPL